MPASNKSALCFRYLAIFTTFVETMYDYENYEFFIDNGTRYGRRHRQGERTD